MKLTRKLTALAMAVLLAFTLTACSPKAWAQDTVVKLVKAMGLVEESEDDDTDTTTKAAAGGSVEFPEGMDTSAARVVTYPQDNTLYVSFNSIANRSTEYFVAGGDSMTVTGCDPALTYYYIVQSKGAGVSAESGYAMPAVPQLTAPLPLEPTNITSNSFTANWEEVPYSQGYTPFLYKEHTALALSLIHI